MIKTLKAGLLALGSIALGWWPITGVSADQGMPPPCLAGPHGVEDCAPSLSPDGQSLVWVHREAATVRVCLLKAPWTGPVVSVEMPNRHEGTVCTTEMSRDGRRVFLVGLPNGIYHVSLQDGHLGVPELLPETKDVSPFCLSSNEDGSRLAVLVDGASTPRRAPGWRAVALLERTERGWKRKILTPAKEGRMGWMCRIGEDASILTYTLDDKPFCAECQQSQWVSKGLAFTGLERVTINGMSANGKSLVFSAWPADVVPPASHPYLANLYHVQWQDGRWQPPVMFMADQQSSIYNVCLSPDGKTVMWIHYTRGEDPKNIVRTEFRCIRWEKAGWSKPMTVLRKENWFQCKDCSLADNGTFAFSQYHMDASHDGLQVEMFLIPELRENATPISISQLVQKKP